MTSNSEILNCVREGKPITHIPVIDMHTHLACSSEYYYIPYHTPAEMVRYMDRYGIDHILTFGMTVTSDVSAGNEYQYAAHHQFPQRISTLTKLHAAFPEDWIDLLEDGNRNGTRGIKLISQYQGVDETRIDWSDVFEYARDKNWIVLHHSWAGVERLERWAKEFPEVTFIIGHAAIEYKDIVNKYDNVFQCTCAAFIRNGQGGRIFIEQMVNDMDVEKILHGSDALDLDFGTSIGPIAYANISEDAKEKILGLNAVKLIKKLNWNIDFKEYNR